MKKTCLSFLTLVVMKTMITTVMVAVAELCFGQANTWTTKADISGTHHSNCGFFALGGKVYVVGGLMGVSSAQTTNDVNAYDIATDTWSQLNDYEGVERLNAIAFAINGKGYYGLGSGLVTGDQKNMWEYDPATDDWTRKADIPDNARHGRFSFVVNDKAYICGGDDPIIDGYTHDVWEYDPAADSWTHKNSFPFTPRVFPTTFAIGNHGYVGVGRDKDGQFLQDFWQYDPSNDSWTRKADFPYPQVGAYGFATATRGFFMAGTEGDLYSYYPSQNAWTQEAPFPGIKGNQGIAVLVDGKAYITTGTGVPLDPTLYVYITAVDQDITFNALPDKSADDAPFQLTGTTTSALTLTYTSSNTDVATIVGDIVTIVGEGTTTITAKQDGDNVYHSAVSVLQNLVVKGLSQSITFGPLDSKKTDDDPFDLTATATSGLTVIYASSNTDVATVSGATVTIVGGGTTTITARQNGDATYEAATPVEQTLTVTQVDQTITFNPLDAKTFTDPSFNLTATASSGLPLTYTSSDTDVATIDGSTVIIVGAGTTTITASQAGNNSYNAAAHVDQALTISPANQTIAVDSITAKVAGGKSFDITASASSNLALTITADGNEISIEGNTITPVKAGKVTLKLNQPGNTNYNAATEVKVSFCVNPQRPGITPDQVTDSKIVFTTDSDSGNQWYKDDVALEGSTGNSISVRDPGVYSVQATIEGCQSDMSKKIPVIITGDVATTTGVAVYPNPSEHHLYISLPGGDQKKVVIMHIDGRISEEYHTSSPLLEVDVHNYSPGLYLVRVGETVIKFIKK
jgi:N-acetylneuraminic acid mutarotase